MTFRSTQDPLAEHRAQPKELSIIQINARSLRRKLDLHGSEGTDHDVIIISETWLSADMKNKDISIMGIIYRYVKTDLTIRTEEWQSH